MNNIDKSMPPKKSMAARKTEVTDDEQDTKPVTDESVKHNGISDEADGDKDSLPDKNIFKEEIVEGKRKRNSPASEQALREWFEKNLKEEEDGPDLRVSDIYKCYLEMCTLAAMAALEENVFKKMLQQTFPKGVALVENSPYNDIVRKKKKKKEKKDTKVKADSLQLKMKDIIKDAITAVGNPRKGVSARVVKHWIAGKYPALQVDRRPTMIASALVRECNYGHIECVRGIGASGVYRLPRTPEEEAEEVAAEKKAAKEKAQKKKDKLAAIGEGDEEGKLSEDDKAEGDKKGGSEEKGDVKAEKDEKEEKRGEESGDKKSDEKKKKKRKSTKTKKKRKERVDYENPMRIEDAFELAFTYNCEPKEASGKKILKYLQDFYQENVPIEKFKKCIESGCDKGFWCQVTGPIGTGTVRLTIDEFDPTADDDLIGKIMNAIVACTEPKRSSAILLKKYITDYHPDFKVDMMPKKYGHALQRAINNNKIVQLSGIGATGSFQLVEPFRPSPLVLQGKGTSELSDDESMAGGADLGVDQFLDAYKPRPSKRRGMGRTSAATIVRLDPSVKTPRQGNVQPSGKSKSGGRNVKKAVPQYKDSDDEESEDEVVPVKKRKVAKAGCGQPKSTSAAKGKNAKKAKPAKKAKVTPSKRKASKSSEDEAEESEPEAAESDDDVVEYTPRKSTSQGGAAAKKPPAKSAIKKVESESESEPESKKESKKGKVSRVAARSGKRKLDETSDEEDEKPEYTPRKTASRGGRSGAKVPAKKAKEESSEEEADSEPEIVESKSRGGKKAAKSPAPKSAKAAKMSKKTPAKGKKGSQKVKEDSSGESDMEDIPMSKTTPAKGKKGSKKVAPPTPVKDDSMDESDLEEIPVSKKAPAKGKKGSRKASPPPPVKDVPSDDSDIEEIPAPSSARKSRSGGDLYSVKVVKPQAGGKKSAKSATEARSLSIVIEKRQVDNAESFQTKAAKKVVKKRKGKK